MNSERCWSDAHVEVHGNQLALDLPAHGVRLLAATA